MKALIVILGLLLGTSIGFNIIWWIGSGYKRIPLGTAEDFILHGELCYRRNDGVDREVIIYKNLNDRKRYRLMLNIESEIITMDLYKQASIIRMNRELSEKDNKKEEDDLNHSLDW